MLHIGHGIYWYGAIIALGLILGLLFCMKQAKRFGLTEDNVIDLVLWATPISIIGARLYYVIFYLDRFRTSDGGLDFKEILTIWDGRPGYLRRRHCRLPDGPCFLPGRKSSSSGP